MTAEWKFSDAPETMVITVRQVAEGETWIKYVLHDGEDSSWQFHGPDEAEEADMVLVSLQSLVMRDPSIAKLADLPLDWQAFRAHASAPWKRESAD